MRHAGGGGATSPIPEIGVSVANHKDAIKRARQSEKHRLNNRHDRSTLRTEIKKLRAAIDEGDLEAAQAQLPETVSALQRYAQKGLIHPRNASRHVSRLSRAINGLKAAKAQ